MSVEPGKTFEGRYTVENLLGEGGFGTVYAGRQTSTGQRVAIKVLNADRVGSTDDTVAKRFEREMQIVASIHHPNIVRLVDSGRSAEGELYAVMELVDGEDLAHLLAREGALEPFDATRLMSQVLDALSSAHALGVIHRDLKPHNIMVSHTGARRNAVVLDFGIAGVSGYGEATDLPTLSQITSAGQIPGTPAYMAPDQIEGLLTPQIDIYAWGLVFLECLTGRPAVTGTTPLSTLVKHAMNDPVPMPERIRALGVGPIIERALEKRPEFRYPSAQAVLDDLEGLERGVLVAPSAPLADLSTDPLHRLELSTAPNPQHTSQIRALSLAAGALVLLIGVAVLSLAILSTDKDEAPTGPGGEAVSEPSLPESIDDIERVSFEVIEVGEALSVVAWIPESPRVVIGGEKGALAVYDVTTRERVLSLPPSMITTGLAVSPRGRWLAAGGMGLSGFTVSVFELPGGELTQSWPTQGVPDGLAFSPDDVLVTVPSLALELRHLASGEVAYRLPSYEATVVETLFLSGEEVIVARGDGSVVLYNIPTERELRAFTKSGILSAAAVSGDGEMLVTAMINGELNVWDIESGQHLQTIRTEGGSVYDAALSADGRVLATACGDGTVQLWDVGAGERERVLELGRRAPLMSVDFHPTEQRLAAGGKEGVVALWTLKW